MAGGITPTVLLLPQTAALTASPELPKLRPLWRSAQTGTSPAA